MSKMKLLFLMLAGFVGMNVVFNMLSSPESSSSKGQHPSADFTIISGSENKTLEPLIHQFARQEGVQIDMKYKGSIDIMRELEAGASRYDAIWPANSLWIALGDKQRLVKHSKSIMISPVVFGVRKPLAEKLGFVDQPVTVADILEKIKSGDLSFTMTSATQSNSGATSYLGFLYALLGNPETIQPEDLDSPDLQEKVRELLSGVNRSSGSSGWLKELFVESDYDAMVNYEALIIEANQELIAQGKEPLYAIYPTDGLAMADSPLGYVNHGDMKKEELFKKLQAYLLSLDVQNQLLAQGRRTGLGGTDVAQADEKIFNPHWGIDTKRVLNYIRIPSAEVIRKALHLYQTELRKPSLTIFLLDYSGSMKGDGISSMKQSMKMLLDKKIAEQYLLQPSKRDKLWVLPFNHGIIDRITGNIEEYPEILKKVESYHAEGGTDIYRAMVRGMEILLQDPSLKDYTPALILMTDGRSEVDNAPVFREMVQKNNQDIPVFSIMFGSADPQQLEEIAKLSRARVFDGKKDLAKAFRQAKGYN